MKKFCVSSTTNAQKFWDGSKGNFGLSSEQRRGKHNIADRQAAIEALTSLKTRAAIVHDFIAALLRA